MMGLNFTSFAIQNHFNLGEFFFRNPPFELFDGFLVCTSSHHEVEIDILCCHLVPRPSHVLEKALAAIHDRVKVERCVGDDKCCL